MNDMIYIRADANEKIATGHIMRCSAIAEAFVEMGREVCYIVADKYGEELVSKLGFPCLILNSNFENMDGEIDDLQAILRGGNIELLLVDSYYVSEFYFESLKGFVQTAYIDDSMGKNLPCDVIVNYDLDVNRGYYGEYNGKTKFLLGGKYTPLRKQFRNQAKREIKDIVSEILILAGGSDHFHVVFSICKALISHINELEDCVVNIVCGRYNDDYESILEVTKKYDNIRVYRSVDEIDIYMKHTDVCISAGGTTTKELAACGTPTITFSVADNQLAGVKSLDRAGLMKYFGDVRNVSFSYSGLIEELLELCEDKKRRVRESRLLQQTIDGLGAVRIAKELIK